MAEMSAIEATRRKLTGLVFMVLAFESDKLYGNGFGQSNLPLVESRRQLDTSLIRLEPQDCERPGRKLMFKRSPAGGEGHFTW